MLSHLLQEKRVVQSIAGFSSTHRNQRNAVLEVLNPRNNGTQVNLDYS